MGNLCSRRQPSISTAVTTDTPCSKNRLLSDSQAFTHASEEQVPVIDDSALKSHQHTSMGLTLLKAARDDDFSRIDKLLAGGHSPSWANELGQTPLHIASMQGNWKSVKTLLSYSADIDAVNSAELGRNTPLHVLANSDTSEEFSDKVLTASILIEARANVNATNDEGQSPINLVCNVMFREELEDLVERTLPVHAAVRRINTKDLEGIIQRISRQELPHSLLNARNCSDQTPLHLAAHCGSFIIVKMLVEAAADIHAYEPDLDNDWNYTSRSYDREAKRHATALHICSSSANVVMMQVLLEAQADVNARDSFGCTPLHLCHSHSTDASFGPCTGVRLRVSGKHEELNGKIGAIIGEVRSQAHCQGCDDPECDLESEASVGDDKHRVLLNDALQGEILLKEGNLSTIFHEAIDALLEAHADVNLGNKRAGTDQSVLHMAAYAGDSFLAEKVIAARANVNMQRASSGLTPLHLAIRGRKLGVIHLLLESRADVNVAAGGKTAVEIAAVNGLHLDRSGLFQTMDKQL